MPIQFSINTTETGQKFVTVYANGRLTTPADDSHPSFKAIIGACEASLRGDYVDEAAVLDLFDVAATITRKFQRLSERVTVEGNNVLFDGDPVHGTLQEQILSFMDAGEDFGPLVNFYEKLTTNPLGDVRDGLYDWINGQKQKGNFTITPEGDVLGYKSVHSAGDAYRPSRASASGGDRVNGVEVGRGNHILQRPGDVVEMPRSKVLHSPSQACGDGLHIGTYTYAETFQGDTVLLVQFSPRDIVSLPDSNASWKLRVCRYTVIGPVDGPLTVPVYSPQGQSVDLDVSLDADEDVIVDSEGDALRVGQDVIDNDGDEGSVVSIDTESGYVTVEYDEYGTIEQDPDDLTIL